MNERKKERERNNFNWFYTSPFFTLASINQVKANTGTTQDWKNGQANLKKKQYKMKDIDIKVTEPWSAWSQ